MISVIIVLYRTPLKKIQEIKKYKQFKLYIFEQEGSNIREKFLKKKLKFEFEYFFSKKNIGLSKAINFLINKVDTKYCLVTEPDIEISLKDIFILEKFIKKNKKYIIAGPTYIHNKKKPKVRNIKKDYKIKNFIDPSCVLFDVKLFKEIKFYDDDYPFYWGDIDLMKRINDTTYKIIELQKVFVLHEQNASTSNNLKINLYKDINFKFGEILFDYKHKKFRIIKILRQLAQNLIFLLINLLLLNEKTQKNLGNLLGIFKFIIFIFLRKLKMK